ncbi:unnamed protein product [Candidula unifasciata]|uniref:RNA-binding region-containing protein 3 n=1 Tax=Candidula unifasciata TaxID=100452 RepID=A0A8S3ZBI0_9EUPU|nr:unnamed protein product [Candidula unifasciata]
MEELTLLFRHLPAELSVDERKDLLHYLGASRVKVMGKSGAMKNTAFAVFGNKEQATQVLKQLHQVEFLGSRLVVEFAKTQLPSGDSLTTQKGLSKENGTDDEDSTKAKREKEIQQQLEPREIKFDKTFATWGLKYPRRPELRYSYPPPTQSILTNILNALAAVPKFYVQVLHLMNKMDLPAPFGAVTPSPPIHPDIREPSQPDNVDALEMDISSETESELESGEENEKEPRQKKERLSKRPQKKHLKTRAVKKPRLSDLQDSGVPVSSFTETLPVSQVFEQVIEAPAGSKKIELKLPSSLVSAAVPKHVQGQMQQFNPYSTYPQFTQSHTMPGFVYPHTGASMASKQHQQLLPVAQTQVSTTTLPVPLQRQHPVPPPPPAFQEQQHVLAPPVTADVETAGDSEGNSSNISITFYLSSETGGFGILQPLPKEQRMEEEEGSADKEWSKSDFISSSELKRLKLSSSERKELSVFKNYNEGEPSCRLYLKNLARNVTEEDIHWIYGRYVDWENELETNIFDIKLMKEGRMKGQAFVTLPNEKCAVKAVRDTNGLLLKDKPMVVQFARSAKVKSDEGAKKIK